MQRHWQYRRSVMLLALAFVMSPFCSVVVAQEEAVAHRPATGLRSGAMSIVARDGEITPPDVFAHVALLRGEVELIRSYLGKPTHTQSRIDVSGVAPREVFFQAQTLFRKADSLCFDIVRTRGTLPETPNGEILLSHVWAVVDAALERIRLVKAKLAITTQARRHTPDAEHGPTDVFRSIVHANRQLDILPDHERSLGELFQQITVGVSYASRLLSRFPDAERIPAAPPFEPDADLQDVHDRLLDCFTRLRAIATHSGLEMMSFSSISSGKEIHSSGELYDIATLVVSEAAYLHAMLKDIRPPHPVHAPGDKYVAQVYERAGILVIQLEQLHRFANENPNWLNLSQNQPLAKSHPKGRSVLTDE